jgi:hypothetical protein
LAAVVGELVVGAAGSVWHLAGRVGGLPGLVVFGVAGDPSGGGQSCEQGVEGSGVEPGELADFQAVEVFGWVVEEDP